MSIFTGHDYTEEHIMRYIDSYNRGKRSIKTKIISRLLGDVKGKSILDIGIGSGFFSQFCINRKANTISVDFASSIIEYHRKNNPNLTLIQADAQALPFKAEIFDIVLALDVIEHVNSAQEFLREIKRVLKTKGRLILITPNTTNLIEKILKIPLILARKVLNLETGIKKHTCTHIKEFSQRELSSLLRKSNFKICSFNTYNEHMLYKILDPLISFLFVGCLKGYKWRKAFFYLEK